MKCTFRSSDSDRQLAGSGSAGVAQEAALESGQDAVLDARPVDPHFGGIWCAHHAQVERTAAHRLAWRYEKNNNFRQLAKQIPR